MSEEEEVIVLQSLQRVLGHWDYEKTFVKNRMALHLHEYVIGFAYSWLVREWFPECCFADPFDTDRARISLDGRHIELWMRSVDAEESPIFADVQWYRHLPEVLVSSSRKSVFLPLSHNFQHWLKHSLSFFVESLCGEQLKGRGYVGPVYDFDFYPYELRHLLICCVTRLKDYDRIHLRSFTIEASDVRSQIAQRTQGFQFEWDHVTESVAAYQRVVSRSKDLPTIWPLRPKPPFFWQDKCEHADPLSMTSDPLNLGQLQNIYAPPWPTEEGEVNETAVVVSKDVAIHASSRS